MQSLLLILAINLNMTHAGEPPQFVERSRALITAASKEDFAAASQDFDETMKKVMPADKFAEVWKGLVKQVGPLKKQGQTTAEKVQKYDVIWVECEFEKATLYTRVVFDSEGRVSGLSFRPFGPVGAYKAPAYVKRDSFKESEVRVGEGEWAVPGSLSMPVGAGPYPAIVLVHGSGPQDRDESIGSSKPFRDIAWGLASQGIAVLRYEKRTKEHGLKLTKIKNLTIKEETLDDALLAVKRLKEMKTIDPKRIHILGHSLGAMAAPKLGESDPTIAGLILMAAPSRDMGEVLTSQLDYIISLDPSPSEEQKKAVAKIKEEAEKLKDPRLSTNTPSSQLPFGLSADYWLSVRNLAPVQTARSVRQPLLILQGGRDYQSTMQDFAGWTHAMKDNKRATLKSYPSLNHLFMEGKGMATPAEYQKEGHVMKDVLDDIASWVKNDGIIR